MKNHYIHLLSFFLLSVWLATPASAQQSLKDAQAMYKSGQLTQAYDLLTKLSADNKKNQELRYWKGIVALEMGNIEAARESFSSGNMIKMPYPYHEVGMARVLFKENQPKLAKDKLKYLLDTQINIDFDLKLAIAEAYLEGQASGEGKVLLYQLQADKPNDPRSYILLGDYYWQIKAAQHAIGQYQEAIKLSPEYVPAYVKMGQLLIEEKKYDEGLVSLNKAIELDPAYADAYRYKGELYAKAQKFEEARDNYEKYLALTQNDLRAIDLYGAFLFMCEDYEGTINTYQDLQKKEYKSGRMYRLTGYAYSEMGQPKTAKKWLDQYFERIDEYFALADDYQYYAEVLLALGDEENADVYFAKAVSKDPSRVEVYNKLAEKYKKEKSYENEVKYRQRYVDQIKPNAKSYQKLGIAQYNAKQFTDASETFKKLDEVAPKQPLVYVWQARIAAKLDTTENQEMVKKASQNVVDLLDSKLGEKGELSNWEIKQFGTYAMFLAHSYYNPNEEGVGDCVAAKPYVDRLLELSKTNAEIAAMENFDYIQSLSEYCNQ